MLRYLTFTLALVSGIAAAFGAVANEASRLGTVVALAYSTDGRLLAAGDDVRKFAVFHPGDRSTIPGFALRQLDDQILALQFTPDNQRLVVVTDTALRVFDLRKGTEVKNLPIETTAAALSPDAHFVAYPKGDQLILRDTGNGKRIKSVRTGLGFPETLAFSPDGRFLAIGAQETIMTFGGPAPHGVASGDLLIIDLPSGNRRRLKALSPWFSAIGFSADSSRVAAITFDHHKGMAMNETKNTVVNVWDTKNGESVLQAALPDDTSHYVYLSFIRSTSTVIAAAGASWGGDLALIDTNNGRISHSGPYDIPAIFSAALAPSGKMIATGMIRGVQIRDVPSRQLAAKLGVAAPQNSP